MYHNTYLVIIYFFKTGAFSASYADNYQSWQWKVNKKVSSHCALNFQTWNSNYMICMKSVLPKTKIVTFTRHLGSQPNWGSPPAFDQEQAPDKIESYRVPCIGDSGSGQFFLARYDPEKENIQTPPKYVLAAVYKGSVSDVFDGIHRMPCGGYTYNQNWKQYDTETSFSQSTTYSEIFQWIKFQIIT